jgi:hypothetical protein
MMNRTSRSLRWFAMLVLTVTAFGQKPNLPIAVAAPDFTTVDALVALIPQNVEVRKGGKSNRVAASLATDSIKAGALNKIGQFKIKIRHLEPTTRHGQKFLINAESDRVLLRGERYDCDVTAYFAADQGPELAKLKPGATVTVVGQIFRTDLASPETEHFIIGLKDSHIVPGR